MKKIIVLILCLLGGSLLWAQENTVLGTGALSQGSSPKYAIKEIQIINPGSYTKPTLDFGSHNIQIEYLSLNLTPWGLMINGYLRSSELLNDFVPSVVGGHGTGATVFMVYSGEESGVHYYEVYTDNQGIGYMPTVTLSSSTGSFELSMSLDDYDNPQIYYDDPGRSNLYSTPPTVLFSFGGTTAIAKLYDTPTSMDNTAIGFQALNANIGGKYNTAVGHQSLYNATGTANLALGTWAGKTLTTGDNNIFLGTFAGYGLTTGSGNIFIGRAVSVPPTLRNTVIIADNDYGTTKLFIGSSGAVKIGYGSNFNDEIGPRLSVNGPISSTSSLYGTNLYLSNQLSFKSSASTYYQDFMFFNPNPNTFQMRAVVDENTYPAVFSVDKPSASTTFYAPVKGVNAVNNNEFVTLGQLEKSHRAVDWIVYPGANADLIQENTSSFTYANNAPYNGYLGHFGNGGYGLQLNAPYGGETPLSFRTRNGDNGTWNSWRRLLYENINHRVGIGTESPIAKLDVLGGQSMTGGWNQTAMFRANYPVTLYESIMYGKYAGIGYDSGTTEGLYFWTNSNTPDVSSVPAKMVLTNEGNLGIGIRLPQERLSVNGKIRAREVKVEPTNGWPDYVFEDSYKPLSLGEISLFIKKNKHLPEMPSARYVELNGIELGEMNKLLLKKVEELTLHLIEKDKELKTTNSRLDELEKLVGRLMETQKK